MASTSRGRTLFLDSITWPSRLVLFSAVFFTFAPLGLLAVSGLAPQRVWWLVAVYWVLSGATAVLFAAGFMAHRALLWIAIPLQGAWFALPMFLPQYARNAMLSFEGLASVAFVVVGYVFFVYFIRGEGTRRLRLQTEMALARNIHATLIPPIDRQVRGLQLFGRSEPSADMGGDLLDVVESGDGVTLYIADVSGHGVRAGVVMSMVKSAIRMKLRHADAVDAMLDDLNAVMHELVHPGMFVTCACMRFEADGSALFAGAGHNDVLHYRGADRSVHPLESQHLPLGVAAEERYAARGVSFQPGDVLLFYTDGLTEVFDARGKMMGQTPIEHLLKQHGHRQPREIYEEVIRAVKSFGAQLDDQTLLVARVFG